MLCSWPLVVLALAASTSVAHAEDRQSAAAGRALFNEGVALFNKGDFAAACPKLEESLQHFAGLGTRGKLAACYEKLGRFATAWQSYREVAQLAAARGDPTREQVANERAKALEPKVSYLTILVPASSDAPGLVIKRNGRELDRSEIGAAVPFDPGDASIDVSATGRQPFHARIPLRVGRSVKFEVPALAPEGEASTPTAEPTTTELGDPPSWRMPIALGLAGAGVVAVGIGAMIGLSAQSTYDGAFDGGGCDRASKTCDPPGQSAVDDARSKATVSTVLFGAGAAIVAAGAIVFFTAPSPKPQALRFVPTTYAGGAGVVLGGAL